MSYSVVSAQGSADADYNGVLLLQNSSPECDLNTNPRVDSNLDVLDFCRYKRDILNGYQKEKLALRTQAPEVRNSDKKIYIPLAFNNVPESLSSAELYAEFDRSLFRLSGISFVSGEIKADISDSSIKITGLDGSYSGGVFGVAALEPVGNIRSGNYSFSCHLTSCGIFTEYGTIYTPGEKDYDTSVQTVSFYIDAPSMFPVVTTAPPPVTTPKVTTAPPVTTTKPVTTTQKVDVTITPEEQQAIELLSQWRTSQGLPGLSLNESLCLAADVRVDEYSRGYRSSRPDGSSVDTILKETNAPSYRNYYTLSCQAGNDAASFISTFSNYVAGKDKKTYGAYDKAFKYIGVGFKNGYWSVFFG